MPLVSAFIPSKMHSWLKVNIAYFNIEEVPQLAHPFIYRDQGIQLQPLELEWVAISFSRGCSQPRNRTQVSHIADRHFNLWATREASHFSLSLSSTEIREYNCYHWNKNSVRRISQRPIWIWHVYYRSIKNIFKTHHVFLTKDATCKTIRWVIKNAFWGGSFQ